jgi:hypothetical protein
MEVTTRLELGYLRATATGKFVLTVARGQFCGLLEEMRRARTGRMLVDGREVTGNPRTIERYLYGSFISSAAKKLGNTVRPYPPRFAYVLVPPVLDPHRLGVTVARDRGMTVRAFDDVDEATEWLLGSNS